MESQETRRGPASGKPSHHRDIALNPPAANVLERQSQDFKTPAKGPVQNLDFVVCGRVAAIADCSNTVLPAKHAAARENAAARANM